MLQSFFLLREIMHVLKSIPNRSSLNYTVENHCRWIKDYLVLHSACTPKLSSKCLLAFLVSNTSLSNQQSLQVFLQASCLSCNVFSSSDYAFVIPKEKLRLLKWFPCQQNDLQTTAFVHGFIMNCFQHCIALHTNMH